MEVQEAAPPPNKKLKRWQLSKQRKRDRDRDDPGGGVEALGAARLDPPDPKHQGGRLSLGEIVTKDARRDILNFPIFHFKAKQAKPVEVKPSRIKGVKAEKNKKKGLGTDDIKKYLIIPGKSADTNKTKTSPTKQASQLSQSQSKHQEE